MRIVDLSTPHQNGASEPFPPTIEYQGHQDGARRLGKLAGIPPEQFPDGMALATEKITASAHSGTHVDAPWHYGPLVNGKKARTIDEIPLEWCYGPGVRLDFRHLEAGSNIKADQIEQALAGIGHTLSPGEIVLIQTGADKYWMTDQYLPAQSGLSMEATALILQQGVRCIGIDGWGLDRPVARMAEAHRRGEPNALWPSHFYGRIKEYLQIEKLANLDAVPSTGFTVAAFPVKILGASAGWCRAVAFVDDNQTTP
jgi:kynurenine formamidase